MAARGALMAGVSGAIMLGLAGYSAYKSLTDKGPDAAKVPSAPPPVDTAAAAAAGVRTRKKSDTAGRNATLLTGPMGVTTPAPVTRKTLLGS